MNMNENQENPADTNTDIESGADLTFDLVEEAMVQPESEEPEQETQETSEEQSPDESSDQEGHDEDEEEYEEEEVVETEDTEEEEEDEEDSTEDDSEDEGDSEEGSRKKPNRFQKRIDDLVSQREQEKREKQELQAKLNELLEQEDKAKDAPAKQETATDSGEPDPDALDENGLPVYPLGNMDAQYVRDLAKYTVQTEQARIAQEQEEQRHQREMEKQRAEIQQNWDSRLDTAKEEYTDFDERGVQLMEVVNQFDTKYADYLATMIMDLDNGPDVLYHLASNLDEAKEILQKGPQKATLALGHLDGKVSETRGAKKTKAKAKRVSKAPRPPSSTNKGSTQSMPRVSADTDDLAAYERQYVKRSR